MSKRRLRRDFQRVQQMNSENAQRLVRLCLCFSRGEDFVDHGDNLTFVRLSYGHVPYRVTRGVIYNSLCALIRAMATQEFDTSDLEFPAFEEGCLWDRLPREIQLWHACLCGRHSLPLCKITGIYPIRTR